MSFIEQYLLQLNTEKRRWRRAAAVLTALSLIVALVTTWNLRMTGVTIANSAGCGIEEHSHTEQCMSGADLICAKQEHIHTTDCYSDPAADTEMLLDWQSFFADYPYTGQLEKDLVDIAKTQVGYAESEKNFQVDSAGTRHGYTRYGAWYGAPYNEWSALFVSFCLHFAGADETYPLSSGAAIMAQLWNDEGKFAPVGEYSPESGDLVFFNNNTMGIVTEVYSATLCIVRGDAENRVKADIILQTDPSITGWGVVGEASADASPPQHTEMPNKPIVQIFEGAADEAEPTELTGPAQRFSLRSTRAAAVELIPYLTSNGGSYFYTLLDHNNMELPKDADGNYIAQANESYKLTLTFNSPNGFLPGTYQYQIPNGLMVDGGSGQFVLKDGTLVGSWVVTDTGLITLEFNDKMNSRTDIVISATMGINFPEQNSPIDFDGFITVKVEPPAQQTSPTELSKWGTSNADSGKLNWYVLIKGHADSQIPGSILTDQATLPDWAKPHTYTQSDIDAGINIGVTAADGSWHTWTVTADDPHLIWDEGGWSYKIPQTANCIYCGEIALGSEGWEYLVSYTSTPTKLNTPGSFTYENKVTVDGQTAWGWNEFTHGSVDAELEKEGSFLSDAAGGGFLWELRATIPGRPEGQRAEYSWFIMDEMKLLDSGGTAIGRLHNDVNLSTVMATYNGQTIQIPRIQDATAQDMFAWDVAWTSEGVAATRTINLLCRCQCTASTCHWGGCENYWFQYDDGTWATGGFCQCWTEQQNMTFIFVYKTTDMSLVESYGSLGYQVNNLAQLYYIAGGNVSVQVDYDDASVPVPNLFEKQLTHDFNGYTAHYRITVNEAKAVLTNGTPLTIHDEMTDTLAYISGSLVITTENANGHTSVLRQGVDYTVTYDGTGHQTDASGKKVHVLNIEILKPQPVKYILDYDTTLVLPEQITGGIRYSNSASVSLWGTEVKDSGVEKVYADINIAAKNFTVDMFKTCAVTGNPLPGATFGLYNAQGGLISSGITGENGKLTFQTNIIEGIILHEHTLYYLQEIQPPTAYRLDDTKHWFCFCSDTAESCSRCDEILSGIRAFRIPFEQIGIVDLANYDKFRITIPWLEDHTIEDVTNAGGDVTAYSINFPEDAASKFDSPATVEVEYTAVIEATAAIGDTSHGNRFNKAHASWTSEHETLTTPPDEVVTYVYGIGLLKDDIATRENLAGAKFRVFKDEACTEPLYVIPTDIKGVYIVDSLNTVAEEISGLKQETSRKKYEAYLEEYLKDENGNPIEQDNLVVSQENGKLVILGLKEGSYYLKEVEAPAGYNALTQPVEFKAGEDIRSFTIFADENGNVADIQQTDGVHYEINYSLTHTVVHNSKGVVLPSTGGEGTFWLITIGTLIAIGFAVFLITHKKMSVYTD